MMKGNKFGAETARQGDCVVGILDDDDLLEIAQLVEEANKFKPQEFNEANVQAIFNRCLYTLESKNRVEARPFYQRLGYSEEEQDQVVYFDQDILPKTKKLFCIFLGRYPLSIPKLKPRPLQIL